jgi:TatD DNase family protein
LKKLIELNREYVVAVGEIGTDANSEELAANMKEQVELFVAQAELALEYDLPVIIHTRKSLPETLAALDMLPALPRGVFHSFSHDSLGMEEIVKRGFLLGFGGSVSYSKRIQKVAQIVGSDNYVLETDTPYLPLGFLKEPSSVTMLATIIADLRGENVNTISDITTKNARKLFEIT